MALLTRYGTVGELELAADLLQRALIMSFENNCPPCTVGSGQVAQWWNNHLDGFRTRTRKLYNRANKTKASSDWDL